ncbi:NUMOD4 domain-containing protein [Nocardia farcinica]|uniref:NUMOD4 domain-containing protein n=1 Tax=Nocardia farcinica TaxID=37329 RepID=UPI003446CAC4
MQTEHEEWRPIPGYEGLYEASSLGRIRSLDRAGRRGRVLQPVRAPSGKLKVALSVDNHRRMAPVARLVGEAFLGIPPAGYCIAHHSRDITDDRPANLRIVPSTEVARRNGRRLLGTQRATCRRGHPLEGDNVYLWKDGRRQCLICKRECGRRGSRAFRERRRAATSADRR